MKCKLNAHGEKQIANFIEKYYVGDDELEDVFVRYCNMAEAHASDEDPKDPSPITLRLLSEFSTVRMDIKLMLGPEAFDWSERGEE